MGTHLSDSGKITIVLSDECEQDLKAINPIIDLAAFKDSTTALDGEEWGKVVTVLSNEELINDVFFTHLIEKNRDKIEMSFYPNIIKSLLSMLEKAQNADKMTFIFRPKHNITIEEKLKGYESIFIYNMAETWEEILDITEYTRDPKKKKAIKIPNFFGEQLVSKYMQKTPEHNILIYDKHAEFYIRNKILENILKTIYSRFEINDIDSRKEFSKFNELYEEITANVTCFDVKDNIMKFEHKKEIIEPVDENNMEGGAQQ